MYAPIPSGNNDHSVPDIEQLQQVDKFGSCTWNNKPKRKHKQLDSYVVNFNQKR